MFRESGFWELIRHGGVTLYALVGLSLWSWSIIVERWMKYGRAEKGSERLSARVSKLVRAGQLNEARDMAASEDSALGRLLSAGVRHGAKEKAVLVEAMGRKSMEEAGLLQQRLASLGTIGSVAPYIGLFGTVLGIIRAFQALARSGSEAGAAMVSAGIAEALVATAAGLAVAVPAVVFYNIFARRLEAMENRFDMATSELAEAFFNKVTGRSAADEEE